MTLTFHEMTMFCTCIWLTIEFRLNYKSCEQVLFVVHANYNSFLGHQSSNKARSVNTAPK
jgi:hypothetical protein